MVRKKLNDETGLSRNRITSKFLQNMVHNKSMQATGDWKYVNQERHPFLSNSPIRITSFSSTNFVTRIRLPPRCFFCLPLQHTPSIHEPLVQPTANVNTKRLPYGSNNWLRNVSHIRRKERQKPCGYFSGHDSLIAFSSQGLFFSYARCFFSIIVQTHNTVTDDFFDLLTSLNIEILKSLKNLFRVEQSGFGLT